MIYLIPGTICALSYYNLFYRIYEYPELNLPRILENITAIIFLLPYFSFYLMGLTLTILLHPIIQIVIFLICFKKKMFSNILIIIIFIYSLIVPFIYIYLIWVKGYILTV